MGNDPCVDCLTFNIEKDIEQNIIDVENAISLIRKEDQVHARHLAAETIKETIKQTIEMFWTIIVVLGLSSDVFSVSNLPPTPAEHLTPPRRQQVKTLNGNAEKQQASPELKSQSINLPKESLTDSLARWFLSGSDSKTTSNSFHEGQVQNNIKKRQEKQIASASNVKAIFLTPGYSLLTDQQGKGLDNCNRCDRAPWVPMARALDGGSFGRVPQFALSVPTIQVAFPIHYAVPVQQQQQQSPTQQFHTSQPLSDHNLDDVDYDKPSGLSDEYGPPPSEYGPPPPEYRPPSPKYGSPSAEHKPPPSIQHGKPQQDSSQLQSGSHPLPNPSSSYGTPTFSQQISNMQQLPSTNYGPPFNQINNAPSNQYRPQPNVNRPSISYLPVAGAFGAAIKSLKNANSPPPVSYNSPPTQYNSHSVQSQHQSPSVKVPVLVRNPIPYPLLSTNLIPPMYPYQQFSDGKTQNSDYAQTPNKPTQNIAETISEPNENICNKCKEQNKITDSEPSPAHHTVTEHSTISQSPTNGFGSSQHKNNYQYNVKGNTQIEIMKSIPLAEFLASVEYPMQIIQAPILDVPDLPKYFNLGFQNFPQIQDKLNGYVNPLSKNQNPQSFSEQNIGHALFVNNGLQEHDSIKSSSVLPTVTANSDEPSPTTEAGNFENILPDNHKENTNQQGAESITSSYVSSTNQLFQDTTDKPSQEFNVNSKGNTASFSTDSGSSTQYQTVDITPSLQTHSIGSTLPPTPHSVTLENELQLPSQDNPIQFIQSFNTSSLDQQSNTFIQGERVSDIRYLSPPPITSGPNNDWLLHSSPLPTLSPWASLPPRPFHLQTTHKPRFIVRPTPSPIKKPKQIHQIIVPYTTNKQTQQEFNQDVNNKGWTPLPPSNQGRRVPPTYSFGERLPVVGVTASSNSEQSTQNQFPTGNDFNNADSQDSKFPLSATGSDNVADLRFPNGHSPLNLSPEIMNQILKQWPGASNTGTAGSSEFQHIIAENLQALLNGDEDSVDFERLQKNIDNWTAEGYKSNSPSVNFSPITTLTHLAPSKKIPEEYLTTESNFYNSTDEIGEEFNKRSTTSPFDYEVSASQNSLVKAASEPHIKFLYNTKENMNNESDTSLIQELNGWSLLETRMKSEKDESKTLNIETTTEKTEPKEKLWDKIPVSISPLTNEKVYVVTPLTYTERTTDTPILIKNSSSVSSSRVERSYSVQRSVKTDKVHHSHKSDLKKYKFNTEDIFQSEDSTSMNQSKSTEESASFQTVSGENITSKPEQSTTKLEINTEPRLEDGDSEYIRNFPDLFHLLETQEDVDSVRKVAVELKREKKETPKYSNSWCAYLCVCKTVKLLVSSKTNMQEDPKPTIPEFFSGQSVFITGGTGFLGKVLIEKLLRDCPNIKTLYLLIRPKRNKSPEERWTAITEEPLFHLLKKEQPHGLDKIVLLNGDIGKKNLGLSSGDIKIIENNVTLIFHAAASISFNEPVRDALLLNTYGTHEVVEISKNIRSLQALVYVSSAYSNCNMKNTIVEEKMYEAEFSYADLLNLELVSDDGVHKNIEILKPKLIGNHPNTYTFSKNLAEQILNDNRRELPIIITRPSVVCHSLKGPTPGWIDNVNGIFVLGVGVVKGLIRVLLVDEDNYLDYCPVDFAINGIIVATWYNIVNNKCKGEELPVYNITYGNVKTTTFKELMDKTFKYAEDKPFDTLFWYPTIITTKSSTVYFFCFLILQLFPAMIADAVLWLKGKQTMAVKIMRKFYYANTNVLLKFSLETYNFDNTKFKFLWSSLEPKDKEIFYLEPPTDDVNEILEVCIEGTRRYLFKEDDKMQEQNKIKFKRLYWIHLTFQMVFYSCVIYLLWKVLPALTSAFL